MEIITLIILLVFSLILAAKGLFVEPINPYFILFASMFLFLASMGMIAEGLEVPTGDTQVFLNMSATQINGTINDVQEIQTGIRTTSFNLILLLLSLYLAFLGVGTIINKKYGEADVE